MGAWRRLAVVLGVTGLLLATVGRPAFAGGATADEPDRAANAFWPLFGGDATRSAQGVGGVPYLEWRWRRSLLGDGLETPSNTAENILKMADNLLLRRQVVIPAAVPITVRYTRHDGKNVQEISLVVYRTYSGIQAVDPTNGKLVWAAPSNWGLENMASSAAKLPALNSWLQFYLQANGRPGIVYENSVLGTLSTDGTLVFAVEDLAVPPPPNFPGNPNAPGTKEIDAAVKGSLLQAFELAAGGKLKWQVGGAGKDAQLGNALFLGSPLPYQGSLYVLRETAYETPAWVTFLSPPLKLAPALLSKSVVRVARLDPATGKVLADEAIFMPRVPVSIDSGRRLAAAHLAAADGVLVVPTNAGSILGVDLKRLDLLWKTEYVDRNSPEPNPRFVQPGRPPGIGWPVLRNATWKVTAPVIHGGRVVCAAPDGDRVECLNLKDGTVAWRAPKAEDDLYLAGVFGDHVVIVGKRVTKALSLAKGEVVWNLETGVPSGFGMASDGVYYLPLRAAADSGAPEVCAIELANGRITSHSKAREKNGLRDVPGNLVFSDGQVLSQTTRDLVAYPQLKARLAAIDALLTKNPADPLGLTDRGELRLNNGDLPGATDDLRKALENKPPKETVVRARGLLYETLSGYLERDFAKAEPFLKEYEGLGKLDTEGMADDEKAAAVAEEKRRRAAFLLLVARGREQQGRLREALGLYLQFAETGADEKLLPSPQEPAVKLSRKVWVRQRIGEMLKNAPADKAKELQDEIDKKWKDLRGAKNSDALRDFSAIFGAETEAGREARLTLAADRREQKDYLGAERYLEEVRRQPDDAARSGRALYLLAQMQAERGLIADAVYYYRILARDYAKTPVADGKTGKDLFDALAADKRFLPFLDETPPPFTKGPFKVEEAKPPANGFNAQDFGYTFVQSGEELPFFKQYRVALVTNTHQLKIASRSGDEPPRMDQHLTTTTFAQMHAVWNPQSGGQLSPEHHFLNNGHLVVLPLGHMVFGIDPVDKKVLWEKNLYAPAIAGVGLPPLGNAQTGMPPISMDPRDNTVQVLYANGWRQRLGKSQPFLAGGRLIVDTSDGLTALDAYSGKTLWQRDEGMRDDYFGDDEYVAIVARDGDGKPTATRVVRAADGGTVKALDFHAAFAERILTVGRIVVAAEIDKQNALTLRRYDVATGKDVWKKTFPAGTRVVRSGNSDWYGVIEPDGTARLFGVTDGKEGIALKVDPKHLDKVESVEVFADDRKLYLACNKAADPALAPWGGVQRNLLAGTGLRSQSVNGELYAFDRATGEVQWHNDVTNQQLVLADFAVMPVLIFTARYNTWVPVGGGKAVQSVVATQIFRKSSGKLLFNQADTTNRRQQFHSLKVDAAKEEIELTGWDQMLRVTAKKE